MFPIRSNIPLKGRGAISNGSGRYERYKTYRVNDGWIRDADFAPSPIGITVTNETPKTIISSNQSPDIAFDLSLNAYRGCEHGCIYCFARPTHAYHGMSPGLDFERQLFAKPNAATVLENELRKPGYKPKTLAIGTNTDPYQPIERNKRITRKVLEILSTYNHPVAITTKSQLILRDLDILASMAERSILSVGVSITTLDRNTSRIMEPRAPTPKRRLETVHKLASANIPVTVMLAPVIPGINDHEIENIIAAAAEAGAEAVDYILLRLPKEVKGLFKEWLGTHYPDRAQKVLSLISQHRGGKLSSSNWFKRMQGDGPLASLLKQRVAVTCKRFNLNLESARSSRLRKDIFGPPPAKGDQLSLFQA